MVKGCVTMMYDGTDPEKLPRLKIDEKIYQNKVVDTTMGDQRQSQFHTIYNDERHVITVTYLSKRRYLELRLYKKKYIVRG